MIGKKKGRTLRRGKGITMNITYSIHGKVKRAGKSQAGHGRNFSRELYPMKCLGEKK